VDDTSTTRLSDRREQQKRVISGLTVTRSERWKRLWRILPANLQPTSNGKTGNKDRGRHDIDQN
jgi:hypothetical protein